MTALFDKQKGVAVHLLFIIIKRFDGVTDLSDRGKDIHGHGFRGGPGHFRVLAQLFNAGA